MELKPEQLLVEAITAARAALRDLEPAQVPASLHRVAGYSGKALPPPFARSLLKELAANEHLRTKALEVFDPENTGTTSSRASRAFLQQEGEWIFDLAAAAHDAGARQGIRSDRSLEVERDALQAEVESLRERLKGERQAREALDGELKRLRQEQREPIRADRATEDRLRQEVAALEKALASNAQAHAATEADLRARLAEAQERARVERRGRADAEAAAAAHGPGRLSIDTPETLARHLDFLAAQVSGEVPAAASPEITIPAQSVQIPPSLLPDSADAIDWLRGIEGISVVIDGYNLGFLLAGRLDPPLARTRVAEVTRRLRAGAALDITVVFDSEIEDAQPTTIPEGGSVSLVYSAGRTADDQIVELAAALSRVAVVSNDREVRQRSESVGAVALWSDALVEWSRRR